MTKQTKQIELPEKMTIELPAEALGVIENSQNAYIHANGVVYRVIEESKYWNEIKSAQQQERQRVIEEVMGLIARDIASVHYKINATKNIGGQLQFRKGKFDGLTKLHEKVAKLNQMKGDHE